MKHPLRSGFHVPPQKLSRQAGDTSDQGSHGESAPGSRSHREAEEVPSGGGPHPGRIYVGPALALGQTLASGTQGKCHVFTQFPHPPHHHQSVFCIDESVSLVHSLLSLLPFRKLGKTFKTLDLSSAHTVGSGLARI